ncbi:phenylacetic acid degradation operon negative regulatory protein [Streptomyces achromogenes]|uniref:Phenylacetic acid degradation operon negative regulatory protein n=1 Tax=Streptomyces achromogenes TaxID=67255 RepID=A0ABU0Q866_STRAH|nr:phenylacetic acid degradation operon negative regulatory protein [Streptomyces achromogenes]
MINVSDQPAPRSLIVTLYGAYGRFVPGPVPVAELIRLLAAVGVDAPSVRSSVSRLKRRGLLLPARTAQGAAGYELSAEARQLLEDGDRRVYATAPPADEGWVLAVFSVPESERQKRHVLRSRLAGLGFGTATPGVWIAPARLHDETRHTLRRLHLDSYVDLFRGEHLGFAPTVEAVARWWDLAAIAKEHETFLDRHARVLRDWRQRTDTPARGGLPRLPPRAGLLASSALRRPRPARPAAAAGLAGHAVGGRLPGAARAAARRGSGVRRGVRPGAALSGRHRWPGGARTWRAPGPVRPGPHRPAMPRRGRRPHLPRPRRGLGASARPVRGGLLPARYGAGQSAPGPA